ncbi:MAG: sulfatase [Bryobacterales bacterium]|nr:sulfatase [Bryobacterales bacterium]
MLTRRGFLAAALGAAGCGSRSDSRPNVLFLSVDDMNDWVGCLGGYPGVQTPHIDALARRGALFRDAHCSSPLCNPSRTSVLTGMRPGTTGIYGNEEFWRPALPDVVTLPMHMKANGYHAAGAGKVFHHTSGFNPPDQWDEYQIQEFDDPWYRRTEWYPWVTRIPNPPGHPFNGLAGIDRFAGEFDWGVLPGRDEDTYGDMAAVRYGREFLKREHTKPFFLALGLWHPHIPLFAPQKYFDLYPEDQVRLPEVPADDLDDLPEAGKQLAAFRRHEHERIVAAGKWKEAVRAYLACISFADAMVGRIVEALDASPYADNTVIVLWSDHGWHLGEKVHWHKSTLWQRATHVPLIFAGPGVAAAGTPRDQPVELLDIYPTLVEMLQLPRREDLEGLSLVPLLRDPSATRRPAVSSFQANNHAVITPEFRYIRYHDGGEELYDRRADPNEWKNLASEPRHTGVKQELAQWIPTRAVPRAPVRDQYDFDFATYSYRRK